MSVFPGLTRVGAPRAPLLTWTDEPFFQRAVPSYSLRLSCRPSMMPLPWMCKNLWRVHVSMLECVLQDMYLSR